MLKQRVITALGLLLVLLPALFSSYQPFFFSVTLVLITASAWEWGRLHGCKQNQAVLLALVCAGACAMSWYCGLLTVPLSGVWLFVGLFWVLLGIFLLRAGVPVWSKIPLVVRLLSGLVLLWLAWLALAQARAMGTGFLISIFCLVWGADVFAYFSGKAWGGRFIAKKLAASISPGKSWEGFFGAVLGVVLMAVVWAAFELSFAPGTSFHASDASEWSGFYGALVVRYDWVGMLLAVVFLVAMSVVGDLVESLIKRSVGVKDSSRLLPGHGGVLDRIDALLPVLPLEIGRAHV